jgi:uncharacterized membrane protein
MLSFFVDAVTLALPPALAWTVLFAAAVRLDRRRGLRLYLAMTGVGVVAAFGLAVLRQTTNWVNRELLLLGLLPLAVILGAVVLVWVWRTGDAGLRAWGRLPLALWAGTTVLLGLPDVFLLTIGVVVPGASPFTSEAVLNSLGYGLGLAAVGASAWAVHRAAGTAGALATRIAVTATLALWMADQLTTFTRILLARRLVDVPDQAFGAVVWLVNNAGWFTAGLMVVCLVPIASAWIAGRRAGPDPANPAAARLLRATALSRRRFLTLAVTGLAGSTLAMTVGRTVADTEPVLSPPEEFAGDDHEVWVELASIDDGHLHRYAYAATEGTQVRFLAIRKSVKAFVAVLDACNICGPAGYFERNGQVICKMCDVAMNIATIGFKGGCNPIPIDFRVADGRLVVTRAVLEASAEVFA